MNALGERSEPQTLKVLVLKHKFAGLPYLLFLSCVLLVSCGGRKVLPDWARPGIVAVVWPELDGQIGELTGRKARTIMTAVRSHLLVEISYAWKLEAVPAGTIEDPAYRLETQIFQWERFFPPGGRQGTSVGAGNYVYGLRMVLVNREGEVLWSKSRRKNVGMKTKGKNKVPRDIISASRDAVRDLVEKCPLTLRSREFEEPQDTP